VEKEPSKGGGFQVSRHTEGKGGLTPVVACEGRPAPARKRRRAPDRGLGAPTCGLGATVPRFNLIQTGQTWFKPI
jgi:hypothetical protein